MIDINQIRIHDHFVYTLLHASFLILKDILKILSSLVHSNNLLNTNIIYFKKLHLYLYSYSKWLIKVLLLVFLMSEILFSWDCENKKKSERFKVISLSAIYQGNQQFWLVTWGNILLDVPLIISPLLRYVLIPKIFRYNRHYILWSCNTNLCTFLIFASLRALFESPKTWLIFNHFISFAKPVELIEIFFLYHKGLLSFIPRVHCLVLLSLIPSYSLM